MVAHSTPSNGKRASVSCMTVSMGTALVTGATAGIGAEFCRQLAARGHDLVLVARNEERLNDLASELSSTFGVTVEVLVVDLLDPTQTERVEQRIADPDRAISVLVNNAGFGLNLDFDESTVDDEQRLLDILVTVPMRLSHAAIGAMLARGTGTGTGTGTITRTRTGTIINVTSIAAFAPLGSYSAAKAWLQYFSRWANAYYRPRGLTVMALAPGFVRTEFHERMGVERESMAPRWMWLDVAPLVRTALKHADRRRAVSIPTVRYRAISWVARGLPMWIITRVAKTRRWSA